MKKIPRRDLLKALAAAAGGLGLQQLLKQADLKALAQDELTYLPIILKAGSTSTGKGGVVHLYSQNATNWDFSTGWYGNYIDQNVVNTMVNTGLKTLTGASTVTEAWQTLIPNYQQGDGIAIKVNFNTNDSTRKDCTGTYNIIDAVPQPVRSLIAGLVGMGVHQDDIWIFDATRMIPTRFKSVIQNPYASVRFYEASWATSCSGGLAATFNSTNPTASINFSQGTPSDKVPDVLVNAKHLINVPIMKCHYIGGVSLGFKHHFGCIQNPWNLHNNITPPGSTTQNPLVDIFRNANIGAKTRLTMGDGLVGAFRFNEKPVRWSTFGNDAPNSLFFSTDPVAIDCVMYDFLQAEGVARNDQISAGSDNYLKIAHNAGLGIFEHRDSQGNYSQIDYVRVNL